MRPSPDVDHVCPKCGDAWPLTPDYWPAQTAAGRRGHLRSPCRACAARKSVAWRRARGSRPWPVYRASLQRRHGLRGTYTAGCRCDPCRAAEREYKRQLRARVG